MLSKSRGGEPVWLDEASCSVEEFKEHQNQKTDPANYPHALDIAKNIPLYDGQELMAKSTSDAKWQGVMAEWNRAFKSGPGCIAIRNGYSDLSMIDQVTEELNTIIAEEEAGNAGKGDHFATAGANSRIWNSHEKLGVRNPKLYAKYNANELIRRASESWLGCGYQITMQANVVRPGGKAQVVHRDYHMGFQTIDQLKTYPASQHELSAQLTLQGAIAHSDMPIESGPTKLLPFSQSYTPGYIAVLLPEFRQYFEENYVQLPLFKGDMLFFNPATFHAAGDNKTQDIQRFANLMQIGSAYGRSIEIVDRLRLSKVIYPQLLDLAKQGTLSLREVDNVIAATAEGYPFPANLDIDSPLSGMAPPSQQDIMRQALAEGWEEARLIKEFDEQQGRKRSH